MNAESDGLTAVPSPDEESGLPSDLARVLRDQSVVVSQDGDVFQRIADWASAPSNTASADTYALTLRLRNEAVVDYPAGQYLKLVLREAADALAMLMGELERAEQRAVNVEARAKRAEDALRYIVGYDVAGYDSHLRPEEVAAAVLMLLGPESKA